MSRTFQPRPGFTVQAYEFALAPTEQQADALRSNCGGQRFAYNWALARVKANLDQQEAEGSYGVSEDEVTPGLNWSAYSLRKTWNAAKHAVAPWWAENSKEAYSSGLANLATALNNWNRSRKGQRVGKRVGFPRFKSKRSTWSATFTTGAFGLAQRNRRHVRLPTIGTVRTHESTRKLARRIEADTARILKATVSHRRGRWLVSLQAEVQRDQPQPATTGGTVGVDLGVKHLAVLSTGEHVSNPKHLDRAQRKLRRLQRQTSRRTGPDKRTKQKPSNRWHDTQDRVRRVQHYVANARAEGLHQLSSRLVDEFDTVVVEDLNVAGMLKSRTLSRSIADVGMGELRRQLDYKTTWNRRRLVVADRWYPSSKTCSACGAVKTKLRLSERTFNCDACGLSLDRDLNAARNLAGLAEAAGGTSTESCAGTENEPAGNPGKTSSAGVGYRHGKAAPDGAAKAA
ncbi:transposase [Allosaccharopolyspora coralli]|uniref:Transposase n=1 Tax=Allosaccharopolyspora coralli TaxID=2665642 RepID=A0A5Q3Q8Y5_9PSEU|nr:IS607 family element RNA-guided endonuclease TnpB [Allosaccharopolyspora coralli]QGK68818.1 transposase [Allosaccharopolyspora coralli]QGK70932.1 transposase [Allosaccharopolyspora coralli]